MEHTVRVVIALAGAMALHAAPRVDRAANAASLARFATPGYPMAPGSLVVLEGRDLGPDEPVTANGFPLPTTLADVSVQLSTGTSSVPAYVLSASAKRLLILIPSNLRTGDVFARVTYEGDTGFPRQISVTPRNFGIFTANAAGTGPAEAYVRGPVGLTPLTLTAPAMPGQTVVIRGTGLGAAPGDETTGPRPGDLNTGIEVWVGSKQARVTSAGRSDCCAGVDEVVFEVPAGIEGCYAPVVTVLQGALDARLYGQSQAVSNSVTIPISGDGKACTDPTGLTGVELTKLAEGDKVRAAGLLIGRGYADADLVRNPQGYDAALGRFTSTTPARFLRSVGIHGLPAPGSCVSYPYEVGADALNVASYGPALDAGSAIRITGGRGVAAMERRPDGSYAGKLEKGFVAPGSYTIDNGDGGADVGAFRFNANVPAPVVWSNKAASQPAGRFARQRFEWTGGQAGAHVVTFGLTRNIETGVYSLCTERADAGALDAPPHGPYMLPIDSREYGGLSSLTGFGSIYSAKFEAPGLDVGIATFSFLDAAFNQ